MTYKDLTDSLSDLIRTSNLGSKFKTGFFSVGLPGSQMPCVTLDGITDLNDKLGKHSAVLTLWSNDTSSGGLTFLEFAKSFKTLLQNSGLVSIDQALLRLSAEKEQVKMVYLISFYV